MEFRLQDTSFGQPKVENKTIDSITRYTLSYPCSNSYTCTPYVSTLKPGIYKFELYGAAGGYASNNKGGKGGYSVGYYVNNITTEAYFFVGGKGEDGPNYHNKNKNTPGGFNGGGYGGYDSKYGTYSGGGGGGSTDIRIGSGLIESRIIVSAGGGGACGYDNQNEGGNAGGTQGSDGKTTYASGKIGGGATEKSGGSAYTSRGSTYGRLFYGGDASTMYSAYGGGGGGSGYYGGGGGSSSVDHSSGSCGSGGGGSGYIGGVWSSDAVTAQTSQSSNEGNGYIIITNYKIFESHKTIRCNTIICRYRMSTDAYIFIASLIVIDKY